MMGVDGELAGLINQLAVLLLVTGVVIFASIIFSRKFGKEATKESSSGDSIVVHSYRKAERNAI